MFFYESSVSDPGSGVVMPMPEPSGVWTTFKVLPAGASLAGAAMCIPPVHLERF
jgi:hypothetical protein